MKRFTCVILILAMLSFVLVACTPTTTTTSTAAATTAATTAAATEAPTAATTEATTKAPPEPVTLTVFGPAFGTVVTSGVQTDSVAKEIERVTGVSMSLEGSPDTPKWEAMLASGDMTDIVVVSDRKYFKPLIEGNLIQPMDSLLESNGADVKEIGPQMVDFSKKYCSNDTGKLYFLLGGRYTENRNFNYTLSPWVRWDYYKEMGFPEIKSGDDLLNYIEKVVKAHPQTEDGRKVYGFSFWHDWGAWSFETIGQIIRGYEGKGFFVEGKIDMEQSMQTGDYTGVTMMSDDSAFIAAAKFIQKATLKGLVDPDTVTQKYGDVLSKFDAGQLAFCQVGWVLSNINGGFQGQGKTTSGYMPLPLPTDAFQSDVVSALGSVNRSWAISSKCKTPERAMDLINYLFSYDGSRLLFSGVKGVDYIEKNGKLVLTPDTIQAKLIDPDFISKTGIGKITNYCGLYGSFIDPNYNQPLNLFNTPEGFQALQTPLTLDYCQKYKVSYPAEIMYNRVKYAFIDAAVKGLEEDMPTDISDIQGKVNMYITPALVQLSLTTSDAEFDAKLATIRKDLKDMGIQKLYDFNYTARKAALIKRAEIG